MPVIIGANIGTTITAQLVAFKLTDYALPIIAIGAFLFIFTKKRRTKQIGEAIIGFGILFLGLSILTFAIKDNTSAAVIENFFTMFAHHPLLAILVGMIATEIVQSSSVTTGIVVVMAGAGMLDLQTALSFLFGINIGTTITALIASIGTNITAKRAAAAHIMFNVIGTAIAMSIFPLYLKIIPLTSSDLARQVANAHTMFNVINGAIFLGVIPLYVQLIKKIVPGKEVIIEQGPKYLQKNLLSTPSIALHAARKEILRMMGLCREMVNSAVSAFHTENRKDIQKVLARENLVDELRDAITSYLILITQRDMSDREAKMIPSFLHSINDIEKIGDHAENIAMLAERKIDEGLEFSKLALKDLKHMDNLVKEMMNDAIKALPTLDRKIADRILLREAELNKCFIKFRESHVKRLGNGHCDTLAGIEFVDMLANFEKIGDHLSNIAYAIQGKLQWDADDIF